MLLSEIRTLRAVVAAGDVDPIAAARVRTLWRLLAPAALAADPTVARLERLAPPSLDGLIAITAARRAAARDVAGGERAWLAAVLGVEPEALDAGDAGAGAAPTTAAAEARPGLALDDRIRALDLAALARRVATAHDVDPAGLRLDVVAAPPAAAVNPTARTFVITPGADVRIVVAATRTTPPITTLRVVLHELGHAVLALGWRGLPWSLAAAPSWIADEAVAEWSARHLGRPGFAAELLGVDAGAAADLAALERARTVRRRARRRLRAAFEHALWTSPAGLDAAAATATWQALAARHAPELTALEPETIAGLRAEPGAAIAYALADDAQPDLDARLGDAWPGRGLAALAATGARPWQGLPPPCAGG